MRYAASNPRASARGFAFWARETRGHLLSEHPVRIGGLVRDDLQHVPMLDNPALRIEAENVDTGPDMVTRPVLPAMQDDEIALGYHLHEFDALARVIPRGLLEIGDEALLAVGNAR